MCTELRHEHNVRMLTEMRRYQKETKSKKVRRNKDLIERRQEFIEWYVERYSKKKTLQECVHELSDMLFITTVWIYALLKKPTKQQGDK